jgi:hypothetical protein
MIRPGIRKAHGPAGNNPEMVSPSPSFPRWLVGPPRQHEVVFFPGLKNLLETVSLRRYSPLNYSLPLPVSSCRHAYKKPALASTFSLFFPSCIAARLTKSLAGTYEDRRHNLSILTSVRYPDFPLWPRPLPLAPAHFLMASVGSNSQGNEHHVRTRSSPPPWTPPAVPRRHSGKQSTTAITLPSPPHSPARHAQLHRLRGLPERRWRRPPGPLLAGKPLPEP